MLCAAVNYSKSYKDNHNIQKQVSRFKVFWRPCRSSPRNLVVKTAEKRTNRGVVVSVKHTSLQDKTYFDPATQLSGRYDTTFAVVLETPAQANASPYGLKGNANFHSLISLFRSNFRFSLLHQWGYGNR